MREELRELLVGDWWRYTISLVGTLMLAVGLGSILLDGRLTSEELLQGTALVAFCLGLIAIGARIALVVRDSNQLWLILGWMSLGVLVLGALGAWGGVVLPTLESSFEGALVFLSVLAAGAFFGAIIGYYDVRVRGLLTQAAREQARREFLDEQQETLSSLNGILRHQILNDLSAISGRAELLESGKIEAAEATDPIIDHCEHMDETVERIDTLVDILTHAAEPDAYPLGEALICGRADASEAYPALTVDGIESVETTVRADELLRLCFVELFENSAVHGDGNVSVSVRERPDSVRIEITDGGPAVPVDPERLFEPNTRGHESGGDGLGLYFAALIVDRYDGTIELESESERTTFAIELPKPSIETKRKLTASD